nr:polysaccharide deacetylase family protein [uncultured Actinoplanes sp.]
MSPQSSRYPMPAAGDAAEPGGRHRRPESLADIAPSGPALRSIPARRVPAPRQARHQRATRPGRHAARPATTRPPVTGSHRAPGTVPIESWLLMGKTRQQVLLASLVAIGLLFVAIPSQHRRSGVDAVNAAAQRAVGTTPSKKKQQQAAPKGAVPDSDGDTDPPAAVPSPAPSAPAAATTAPTAAPKNPPKPVVTDLGPGHSLRTTGSKTVALTFDDGPDPVQTPKILALLQQSDIKATFCLVGEQVRKHPEIVRQIVAAGHTLCNHTWSHSLTIGKDKPEKIKADLERTNQAILAAVPDVKIPFFRAPGGNFTERLVAVADQAGMASIYWEVDPRDWEHDPGETDGKHTDRVIAEVRKHVRPGSIVLSHDFNQPDTIAAYEKLLPWLKANFTLGLPIAGETPAPVSPSAEPQG